MLIDLGFEVVALFQGRALELAPCSLRITVGNRELINGDTHRAVVDLSARHGR